MIRLKYKNDLGEIITPLLNPEIILGYRLDADYFQMKFGKEVIENDKSKVHRWGINIPTDSIQNIVELEMFLKTLGEREAIEEQKLKKQKPKQDSQTELKL